MGTSIRSLLNFHRLYRKGYPTTLSACCHSLAKPNHVPDENVQNTIDSFGDGLLYNTHVHGSKRTFKSEIAKKKQIAYEKRKKSRESEYRTPELLSLKYFSDLNLTAKGTDTNEATEQHQSTFHLPFEPAGISDSENVARGIIRADTSPESEESEPEDGIERGGSLSYDYGTPDPSVRMSDVPCGGCGALLHCNDASIPGYVASEIFVGRSRSDLRSIICQRCHFLKEYNVALDLNVSPDEYPKLLTKIKPDHALVILMVDLTDFPCSIWPGIMEIIGERRPVFIVGNKVDLLPQDSVGYLKNVTECLKNEVIKSNVGEANIKHIALISAKTGYGVEDLINKLHHVWEYRGNVYLIGCTNVGKSTLFNALLRSDYCKVAASDLVQRATVSQWPGTTLNLLKFPILRPSGWRLYLRTKRLHEQSELVRQEKELRKIQQRYSTNPRLFTLSGRVEKTFINKEKIREVGGDPFSFNMETGYKKGEVLGINEKAKEYSVSKWCYDTPGVIHPDQILPLLTVEELLLTLPRQILKPRTYYMQPGTTFFLAGLARIDFLDASEPVRFTVLTSKSLPITICKTECADELYSAFLGTKLFGVPIGSKERLEKWPSLKSGPEISVTGVGWKRSSVDVVLSSAGWVSVTGAVDVNYKLLPWTPNAKGIYVRDIPLLAHAVHMKGSRIQGTPAYNPGAYARNLK